MLPVCFEKVAGKSEWLVLSMNKQRKLGTLGCDDAGYCVFFPEPGNGGYWCQNSLRLITDKLVELNHVWNEKVSHELEQLHLNLPDEI